MATVEQLSDIEERLSSLGKRLKANKAEETALTREIKLTLAEAQRVDYPMTRAAEKLGLHRTTLYRAYLP